MIDVATALSLVLQHAVRREPVRVRLAEAVGLVLAENIASDIDSPPHDKALVDGYAVLSSDIGAGPVELRVLEEVTAGALPTQPVISGTATRVMTGAPLPVGADAVVMVEQTQETGNDAPHPLVRIETSSVRADQNVMRRATSMRSGETVLKTGTTIRPIEVGLLAEVGRQSVLVHRRPEVAVLATGNELVDCSESPGSGSIRNSNGPMLAALAAASGATPRDLGIARDEPAMLRAAIARGLESDVLVISGGVSAGVLDLVPAVLAEAAVRQVFHKVHLKPGKPLWFGVTGEAPAERLVFGLPGNPVSSLVCFGLFVRPALDALRGVPHVQPHAVRARLQRDHQHRGDRPTYYPARQQHAADGLEVTPITWHGSADLRALAAADCLIHFPAGRHDYAAGDMVDAYWL